MLSPPLIRVENLQCRIGRRAVLRIAEFTLTRGQHWCLFGPNGAGKSLLAAVLSGRRPASGGQVHYAPGFDAARDCCFVSFEEQQRLWRRDDRLDRNESRARAEDRGTTVKALIGSGARDQVADLPWLHELAARLGLQTMLHRGIRFLSSGQMRRVLIARAIYAAGGATNGPGKLIVLDDPLEAIDAVSRERIRSCLSEQSGDRFATILLCRRARDILPGVTHLALLQDLQWLEQGARRAVESGKAFRRLGSPEPPPAVALPKQSRRMPAPAADEVLVELRHVGVSYGKQVVLQDVNWIMTGADHVVIEGPNGCGKSTLLGLIDGENHRGYGQEVYLFGQRKGRGETVWQIKSRFGVISNELHNRYVRGWKVLDVAVSGFFDTVGLYDDSGVGQRDGARCWLDALGILDRQQDYFHELSFGQQRLVLLARAMVKQPDILVLDEPCVGLDDNHRMRLVRTVDAIAQQTSTRIVYVSHVSDEQPDCINQRVRFVPAEAGGFTVVQERVQPRM